MTGAAQVKSIEALESFRAALGLFASDVDQALSASQGEIARFANWLEHDQLAFWRHELRVRDDKVAEAKADLHRCLSATIDPHRTPSCYQEKKFLEAAKRRFEEAERKLAAVRRWIPIIRQAIFEYRLKVEPLESAVAADVPRGMAVLQSSVARLEAYLHVAPPSVSRDSHAQSPGDSAADAQPATNTPRPENQSPAKAEASAQSAEVLAVAEPASAQTAILAPHQSPGARSAP
jgi:hypothetical protein